MTALQEDPFCWNSAFKTVTNINDKSVLVTQTKQTKEIHLFGQKLASHWVHQIIVYALMLFFHKLKFRRSFWIFGCRLKVVGCLKNKTVSRNIYTLHLVV